MFFFNRSIRIKILIFLFLFKDNSYRARVDLCDSCCDYFFGDCFKNNDNTNKKKEEEEKIKKEEEEKKKLKKKEEEEEEVFSDCTICLETFTLKDLYHEKFFITECYHIFHKECIQEWFKNRTKCPLCQKDLSYEIDNYAKILEDAKKSEKNENVKCFISKEAILISRYQEIKKKREKILFYDNILEQHYDKNIVNKYIYGIGLNNILNYLLYFHNEDFLNNTIKLKDVYNELNKDLKEIEEKLDEFEKFLDEEKSNSFSIF